MNIIGLISVEYDFEDFPGKALNMVSGKSLIRHCNENIKKSGIPQTYLVTNHSTVQKHAVSFKANVLELSEDIVNDIEYGLKAYNKLSQNPDFKAYEWILNIPFYTYKPDLNWIKSINESELEEINLLVTKANNIVSDTRENSIEILFNSENNLKQVKSFSDKAEYLFTGFSLVKPDSNTDKEINTKNCIDFLNAKIEAGAKIKVIIDEGIHQQVNSYQDSFKLR